MLRIRDFFKLTLCVVMLIAVGCERETSTTGEPVVELDCYELNIDGNGGNIPIYYAVTNPIRGERPEVSIPADAKEWIEVLSVEESKIILAISQNDNSEGRQAIISVKYMNMKKALSVYVSQDKAVLDKFRFEVTDVTYKSCKVRYTPSDNTITYMANVIDKAYFANSGVSTEDAFIEAEMSNYLSVAVLYEMTLEELMNNLATPLIYTGEAVREFEGMQHGGEYVVYSYGITFNGNEYNVTTPIHYTIVELPMPSMYDVEFGLTTVNAGGTVTLTVDPQDWDGYYNVQIAPEDSLYYVPKNEPISDLTFRALANAFYRTARTYIMQGNSIEKFLKAQCYKGPRQMEIQLEVGKRYMIIVFAVESEDDAIPVMRSIPSLAYI